MAAMLTLEKIDNNETIKEKILEIEQKRNTRIPSEPSLGCVFKNVFLKPGKLKLADPKQGTIKEFLRRECPQKFIDKVKLNFKDN